MTLMEKVQVMHKEVEPQVLSILVDSAKYEFKNLTGREYMELYDPLILDMVACKVNRLNAEGITGHTQGDVSVTFSGGYPENIRRQLNQLTRVSPLCLEI